MKTNNLKIVSKDYLVEQFYNYHKEYTEKIKNELDEGKQKAITIEGSDINLDANGKMGLNISGDRNNGYYLKIDTSGGLSCQPPVDDISNQSADNGTLVTKGAILSFKGTNKINIVGKIIEGSWDVGNIKINSNSIKIGKTNITYEEEQTNIDNITIDNANITKLRVENNIITTANISNAIITNLNVENDVKAKKILIEEIEYDDSRDSEEKQIKVLSDIKITKNFVFALDGEKNFEIKEGDNELLSLKKHNNKKMISFMNYIFRPNKDAYVQIHFDQYKEEDIFIDDFVNQIKVI